MRYRAAHISADIEVTAYSEADDKPKPYDSYGARRTVKLHFAESFTEDAELDMALEAFAETVRAAATR